MKRILIFGLIYLLSIVAMAAPTRDDLRQLENQIRQEKQAGAASAKKAADLSDELKNVQKKMVQLARTVQEKEDDLTRLEKRLKQMQDREGELKQRLNLTTRQTVQVVTGLQTLALRPPELALMNVHTPLDMLRSRMLMGYSLPIVQSNNRQIRSDLAELSRLKSDVQAQIVRIKSTQTQLTEQSTQMDRLLQQKSLLQAQYQVSQTQSQERVKNLAAQARDLKDLLDKLAREKQQAAQATMRRTQGLRPISKQEIPVKRGAFARAYGRLPPPVRGAVTGLFGATTIGGGHAKGITISGRPGGRVIAPFDGTILFAGPFKNYGQLIILDHGDNYLTLLAGMETITPLAGQQILAGEPIGQLKTNRPELYLEIRSNGQPIDPAPWFMKQI